VNLPLSRDDLSVVLPIFRARRRRVAFVDSVEAAHGVARRPAKVALMLALAHHIQAAIDRGLVPDRSTVARRFGLTTARLTQVLDLLLLAPDIQAHLLELEAIDGREPLTEKHVRSLCLVRYWAEQRLEWKARYCSVNPCHLAERSDRPQPP